MKEILAIIVVLCIGIGCSETEVSPTVTVSVVNERPNNSDETTVVITLKNGLQSNVYLTHSKNLIGFWRIERKIDNAWVDADRSTISYRSFYPNERKMLVPNEILRDSLKINQAGRYRMGFPYAFDEETEATMDSLLTEEFIVE
jgi:hypothetical protein